MRAVLGLAAAILLGAHAGLGWYLHKERPHLEILPPQPTDTAARALSFGDQQLLYRAFTLHLQNAGDTGGRFTPMSQYDIPAVVDWLGLLQRLDPQAHHHTALAVRYFSQERQPDDLRLLIAFIDRDVDAAPERKWYWQTQAVALARDRLKDVPYALQLSRKMQSFADYVPEGLFWTLQMEPILLEDLGRLDEAREVMERVVTAHGSKMNIYEQSWTTMFFERLKK
ncbi:MAG: hypothetical protein JNK21_01045 [Rhodospirillaceae bacterium]|nr:hypothetical protein [Rhodospirillaceae bacterium]